MTNTFPGSQSILLSPVLTQPHLVPSTPPAGGFWPWLPVQVPPQALLLPHSWKAWSSVAIWMKICLLPTSISWPLSTHLLSPHHFPLTFYLLTIFPLPSISWPLSPHLPLTFPEGLGHVPSSFFQHTFVLLPYHDEDVPLSTQGQSLLMVNSQFPTSGFFDPLILSTYTSWIFFFCISNFTASVGI